MDIVGNQVFPDLTNESSRPDTSFEPTILEVVGTNQEIFIQDDKVFNKIEKEECFKIDKLLSDESSEHSQRVNL